MKITTLDILKMLPFEEKFKAHLLENWDKFSDDQRANLEETLWDTYTDLYESRLDRNTEIAMAEIAEGKETMDKDLRFRIKEKTDKEFEEDFQKTVPVANLAEAREELQTIISTPSEKNNEVPETPKNLPDPNTAN